MGPEEFDERDDAFYRRNDISAGRPRAGLHERGLLDRAERPDLEDSLQAGPFRATAVRRFETIRFDRPPAHESCPSYRSERTISTPEAGPGSPYYCLACDTGFTRGRRAPGCTRGVLSTSINRRPSNGRI